MKSLRDNRELYDYLLSLTSVLKQRGSEVLSKGVAFANAQASGLSTEFLGESRIALQRVWKEGDHVLTEEERAELSDVLSQLDEALDRR